MPRGFSPFLMMLAWALPTTVGALGLGDIHVDSALNEPLSAQIDIVGASLDDLMDLRANIATLETFQHYGADRPTFLNSATFKIGRDAQGRPVLNVRSRDSFTDPLVSFLVDLKWRNSELVREYSLLLDPSGLAASRRSVDIAPVVIAPAAVMRAPASDASPPPHRITARDTLRGIVRRAGARSDSQIQRMMIATFRENPTAFDGNINRLHRGAIINLPTSAAVDAITVADAKQMVDAQMVAWRSSGHAAIARPTPVQGATDAGRHETDVVLTTRLQSLEQQLGDLHQQMAIELADMQQLRQAAARAPAVQPAPPVTTGAPQVNAPPSHGNLWLLIPAVLLAAGLAVYGFLRRRLQQPVPYPELVPAIPVSTPATSSDTATPAPAAPVPGDVSTPIPAPAVPAVTPQWPPVAARDTAGGMSIEVDTEALEHSYLESLGFDTAAPNHDSTATGKFEFVGTPATSDTATLDSIAPPGSPATTAEIDMSDIEELDLEATELSTAIINVDATTLVVPVPPTALPTTAIDPAASVTTELDFNLSNLDATAEHVQMPSALNDRAESSEGRTNIVDVLKIAIDRDPHRRDLRMKLLETYYNAATGNRRFFMEVVRKLARERQDLSADEWNKIVRMGRDLAPDDILFTDLVNGADDVAA